MPIRLSLADVAATPLYGRLVFVVDTTGKADVPGATTADLFDNGLGHVFGNYLSASHLRGGLAALCDGTTFLMAVRALADDFYGGAAVDASAGNANVPQVIEALYPDATIVIIEEEPSTLTSLLTSPFVVRVAPDAFDARLVRAAAVDSVKPSGATAPRHELPAPPVFVVGCPRSGTTWLQQLLEAHPSLGGPDKETAAFVSVQALLASDELVDWVGEEARTEAVRRFLAGLFAHQLGSKPGATRFLEKTPIHALHLDAITQLFPDASVIGIHRDGRDVVRSLLQVDAGAENADEAATWWVAMTTAVEYFANHFERTRDERYETLLARPVDGAVELLTWLGLAPDAETIERIKERAGVRVSQYNTTGDVGSGKWRDLSAADLRTVDRVAGDRLIAMGYAHARSPLAKARAIVRAYFRGRARQQ